MPLHPVHQASEYTIGAAVVSQRCMGAGSSSWRLTPPPHPGPRSASPMQTASCLWAQALPALRRALAHQVSANDEPGKGCAAQGLHLHSPSALYLMLDLLAPLPDCCRAVPVGGCSVHDHAHLLLAALVTGWRACQQCVPTAESQTLDAWAACAAAPGLCSAPCCPVPDIPRSSATLVFRGLRCQCR